MCYEIEKKYWLICKICKKSLTEIKKDFGGNGKYFSSAFISHIKEHDIKIEDYFEIYLNITRPLCSCNECNKKTNISIKGSKIFWRKYACGRNDGIKKWSEKAKVTRCGINNPMFGKKPWNTGLDKSSSELLNNISKKMTGKKVSKETKEKQSNSAKNRLIHGHTGLKHSQKSKEKMREKTLKRINNGEFLHTKTKPHIILSKLLTELKIQYIEEYTLDYWSFDFYLPKYNLFIEVDGDYWHSNPKIYPNGPKTKSQKINYTRDLSKNNYCIKNKLKLIRFWESDILSDNNFIKTEIICSIHQ